MENSAPETKVLTPAGSAWGSQVNSNRTDSIPSQSQKFGPRRTHDSAWLLEIYTGHGTLASRSPNPNLGSDSSPVLGHFRGHFHLTPPTSNPLLWGGSGPPSPAEQPTRRLAAPPPQTLFSERAPITEIQRPFFSPPAPAGGRAPGCGQWGGNCGHPVLDARPRHPAAFPSCIGSGSPKGWPLSWGAPRERELERRRQHPGPHPAPEALHPKGERWSLA